MSAEEDSVTIERTMSLTRDEFLRSLPIAVPSALAAAGKTPAAGRGYSVEGDCIVIGTGRHRIEIHFMEKPERRLGALRLPAAHVRFDFFGFGAAERERFMARFDAHYRRGGG